MANARTAAWTLILPLGACAGPRCPEPAGPSSAAKVAERPAAAAGFREVVRQKNYLLEFGPYALEVDPSDGARIVTFALDGQNVVLPRSESLEAYGSSFWTSPQSDWQWPPPIELDKFPWAARVHGARLELVSNRVPKLELAVEQTLAPAPDGQSVIIDYVMINQGAVPRRVAPWQNTRVRPNGLTFFPGSTPSLPQSTLKLAPEAGIVWFRHDAATMRQSGKAFVDGAEGWLAHVDGELLFVKVFPDVPPEAQAPGEAEIEIYVHETGRFVEVEQQGAYTELAPGGRSTWRVQWLLRRLPAELARQPRQPDLVELVRALLTGVQR
jgi:hypothetical protein